MKKQKTLNIMILLTLLTPTIINFIIGLAAGKNNSFTDCMYCMLHPDECKQIDSEVATLCPGLISEQHKYNPDCTLKDEYKNGENIDYSNTGKTGIPAYKNTIAKFGGSAIARTLRDNPNAQDGQYFKKSTYENYSYYLYTPKQIDGNKAALIVYLHGTGGEGTTEAPLRGDGGGAFFHEIEQNKKEYNAYILVIQTPYHGWIPSNVAIPIINKVVQENNIDNKRISLWGYSLGANAAAAIIYSYPNYFSSAVIMSSQIDNSYANTIKKSFATTPTYFLHGDIDPYKYGSDYLYNALNSEGYKIYRKVYPGQGHPLLPNVVLEDTNIGNGHTTIIDWVLDQRRTD